MTNPLFKSWTVSVTLVLAICTMGNGALLAQENAPLADESTTADDSTQLTTTEQLTTTDAAETLNRLQYIQDVLSQKLEQRSGLGESIEQANEQDKEDLRRQADDLTNDIQQLRVTLESIAIGGVDTSLFVRQEDEPEGNWREDVALIAQPVIDSLKELTEKPRRLKELNDHIVLRQQEMDTAHQALTNIQPEMALAPEGDLGKSLRRFVKTWENRRDDARNAIEIARFQIADLQGDKSIPVTIIEALIGFIKGRGLTIVLAVLAALAVWFSVRFLMRGHLI